MKKHETKRFSFPKKLISGCTTNRDVGCGPQVVWSEDITRKQKREVLNVLRECLKDTIEFKKKHYIPSRNEYCETYTRFSNFRWSKTLPNMLYCSTETVSVAKDKMFIDRNTKFIDSDFNCNLVKRIDALQELRSKLNTIIERTDFHQIPIMV